MLTTATQDKPTKLSNMPEDTLLTLFLIIGVGYLLGKVSIGKVRLGGAAVLFAGITAGVYAPDLQIPQIFTRFGLIVFVYTVGLQAGPGFSQLLRTQGLRDSALSFACLASGALATLLCGLALGLPAAVITGLFSGALTNTPALAAVNESLLLRGAPDSILQLPTLAYSIAYPLGVLCVVINVSVFNRLLKTKIPQYEDPPEPIVKTFCVVNPAIFGKPLAEILAFRGEVPFVITRIKRNNKTELAKGSSVLQSGDILVAVGEPEVMPLALQIFGSYAPKEEGIDRSQFDYRRTFVSNPKVIGKTIAELGLIENYNAIITRVKREERDIVPTGSTRLEAGDRVRVLTETENIKAVRKYLGDSIKSTAHADFGSMAFGMALGVLLGSLAVPLPVLGGNFQLGLAGGPLVMGLLLGHLGYTGSIKWRMPLAANLTLRELGLLLFLAGVGLQAGGNFLVALQTYGATLAGCTILVTSTVVWSVLLTGHLLLKIPLDYLLGLLAGTHTQAASLAFIDSLTTSDRTRSAYISVFPTATITKILFAQLLLELWS